MIKEETLNDILNYLYNGYKLIIKDQDGPNVYYLGYDSTEEDIITVIKLNYIGVYKVDKEQQAIII